MGDHQFTEYLDDEFDDEFNEIVVDKLEEELKKDDNKSDYRCPIEARYGGDDEWVAEYTDKVKRDKNYY